MNVGSLRAAIGALVLVVLLVVPGVVVPALWVTSALLLAGSLATLAVLAVLSRGPGHHLQVDVVGAVVIASVLGPMLVWPWTRLDDTHTTPAAWIVPLTSDPHGPMVVTRTHAFWLDDEGGLVSVDSNRSVSPTRTPGRGSVPPTALACRREAPKSRHCTPG